MGSAYIPKLSVERVLIGTTSVVNPQIYITVDGTSYFNGYKVNLSGGFRLFFVSYDAGTGNVYIVCHAMAIFADLPSYSIANVGVIVIG